MQEVTELKAVEQFIIEEFAKYNIVATDLMGIMVFKCWTPQDWAPTAAALAAIQKTEKPKEPRRATKKERQACYDFIMQIGKQVPIFMWDDMTLGASFNGHSRMDIACPFFTEWLTAIIKHIAENDSLATFQYPPTQAAPRQ